MKGVITMMNLKLEGTITIDNIDNYREKIMPLLEMKQDIKLDFDGVEMIDSSGLGLLVDVHKKAQENNLKVIMVNINENIEKLYKITMLDNIFNIEK
jgi:anti-sigma B factor antagonist